MMSCAALGIMVGQAQPERRLADRPPAAQAPYLQVPVLITAWVDERPTTRPRGWQARLQLRQVQHGRERAAILGRAWEALIGAVYLDGGIRSAQRFILRSLAGELETIAVAGLERDPKSMLQEACQAQWRQAPRYFTIEQRGPAHDRDFRVEVRLNDDVLGSGEGKSKQSAEKAAANAALSALPEDVIP